jgi:monothiol glutaredoxin
VEGNGKRLRANESNKLVGIKEYSEWPTIPQLYLDKEFVGGCDILVSMHQNGELAKMLEEKKVLAPAEDTPASE